MSDLAQWKVHGPVQTLKTELAEWDLDKKDWKLPRPRYSAVFRVDGKISRTDHHNPDGSIYHEDHLYDGEGRLVEVQFRTNDGPPMGRTLYSYDDAGRHVRTVQINSDDRRRESELCHYEGQKVKVKFLDRDLTPAGFMYAAEGSEIYHPLNGAAKITTIYDQDDQPVEVHFHDASEQLLQRIIITRDGAGRLAAEELQLCGQVPLGSCCRGDGAQCSIEQRPEDLPPEVQAEMRAILSDQMGPDRVWSKTTYAYDDKGRVSERRTSLLGQGLDRSTFQYDEQGNQIEITEQNVPDESKSTYRIRYHYDSRGNWTECTVTRVEENGMLHPSNVERREITYWDSSSVIQPGER